MPAESKKQQRFFGMVHAVQKGELSPSEVGPAVRKAAKNTEYSDAKDFASTKHKNLPEKKGSVQMKYFEKIAKEDPGYFAKQMATTRAMRAKEKGVGTLVADPKLIGERLEKSITYGIPSAMAGATAGIWAGKLSKVHPGVAGAIGGVTAGYLGSAYGMQKATQQYLAKKGIGVSMWGNVKTMTPKAKKKYLHEKYRGGGFK